MQIWKIVDLGTLWDQKEATKNQTSRSYLHENERRENTYFYTPPMQNLHFGVPKGAKMERQRRLETIFIAIETDDTQAMLVRKLLDAFLQLESTSVLNLRYKHDCDLEIFNIRH